MAGKFYLIKEGSSFDPFVYGMENLPTPWEDLTETDFASFYGNMKAVAFDISKEELKTLIDEHEKKLTEFRNKV